MKLSSRLRDSLKDHLQWNKPRLTCFVELLLALLRIRHTNLARLAVSMSGTAEVKSRYRQLQRFFSEVRFDYDTLARLIIQLFDFINVSYYLTVDRTQWQWGGKHLNLLVLAVVYKGTAIPVYWLVLNKKGNSNQRERIALLKRFIRQFGQQQIQGVLGDREFIGEQWWGWLIQQSIPFVMRMKENQHFMDKKGKKRLVRALFRSLKVGEARQLRQQRHISGRRMTSGELLIIASNEKMHKPFEVYALRWEIETLFQCLKGRGFHLDETRLTHYFRIKKMMAVLVLAFCWAHKTGEWKHRLVKLLRVKKHGRLEQSWFRYGLDYLADQLMASTPSGQESLRMLILLLCPPSWIVVKQKGGDIEIPWQRAF